MSAFTMRRDVCPPGNSINLDETCDTGLLSFLETFDPRVSAAFKAKSPPCSLLLSLAQRRCAEQDHETLCSHIATGPKGSRSTLSDGLEWPRFSTGWGLVRGSRGSQYMLLACQRLLVLQNASNRVAVPRESRGHPNKMLSCNPQVSGKEHLAAVWKIDVRAVETRASLGIGDGTQMAISRSIENRPPAKVRAHGADEGAAQSFASLRLKRPWPASSGKKGQPKISFFVLLASSASAAVCDKHGWRRSGPVDGSRRPAFLVTIT